MADTSDRLGSALKNTLDSHGFSFHYAVVRYCEELFSARKSHWRFEVAEFPVELRDAATRIDFILHGKSQISGIAAYLVCECKRPNPAISQWAFARAPYTRRNRRQRFTVFEGIWIEPTTGRLISAPSKLRDLIEPYDLGIELRGDVKGEPQGAGRGAIEDAATQVLRGVSGLIDFFKDNPRVLSEQALVVPIVFTTARLFSSAVDLGTADLNTGKLPDGVSTEEAPWLWFQYNLSSSLRHSAPKEVPSGGLMSLGSVLEYQHARSIAVVSPSGIEAFLQQMPTNLEDLEALKS